MNDERMTILNMIAQGTVSPEEGEKLLKALEEGVGKAQSRKSTNQAGSPPPPPHPGASYNPFETPFGDKARKEEQENSWETGFENFMEGFGRKMEQFSENWGEELGRRAEMMAEDVAKNMDGMFGGFSSSDTSDWEREDIRFNGIKEWGLEKGFDGEEIDFSSGSIDLAGVRGLVAFAPIQPHRESRRGIDFEVNPSAGSSCRFEPESVLKVVKRDEWILMAFGDDGELYIPPDLLWLGVMTPLGDVAVNVSCAELYVNTMQGDIELNGVKFPFKATSLKGDAQVSLDRAYEGRGDLNTMKGDLELNVPGGPDLDFTAKTMKGDIEADGPGLEVKGEFKRPANNFLTGVVGRGNRGVINLSSMKGDIQVTALA